VELNYDTTIFSEPTFRNSRSFRAGIINQHAFLTTFMGGRNVYYFIDNDGLRSFDDGTPDDRNENRNSAFTALISAGLAIKQVGGCAVTYDNYSLFSVATKYSADNLIAVFDNLRQAWVCFDKHNIPSIHQFAVASQAAAPRLYAITDNSVYEIFGGNSTEAYVELKAIIPASARIRHKLSKLHLTFIDSTKDGTVSAMENVNGSDRTTIADKLRVTKTDQVTLNYFGQGLLGWKIKPKISWNTDGKLVMIETEEHVNTGTPQPEARMAQNS
jgi:hypothetical protein